MQALFVRVYPDTHAIQRLLPFELHVEQLAIAAEQAKHCVAD